MKRLIVRLVMIGAMVFAVRKMMERAGPAMRDRCSEMCDRMLAHMPESFPPNRIMADLTTIKEQNARILEELAGAAEKPQQ